MIALVGSPTGSPVEPIRYAQPRPTVRLMEPVVQPIGTAVTRLVVLLLAVVFALSLIFVAGAQAGGSLRETSAHVVGAGETLWDIAAERTAPGGDVRVTLYDIRQMNDLSGSVLGVGQSLIVPSGD